MGKFNLNLLILILVILVIIMQLRSCLSPGASRVATGERSTVIVQPLSSAAAEGLDLEAVGALLNEAKDAEELEALLNRENGVNNLDLNRDGVVDFIAVTEFGSGDERGFSLSSELAPGEEQEIATIRIQQTQEQQNQGQQAEVQIHGNEALYGPNYYYHSRLDLGDVLLLAWLFSPHPFYFSPFAWGYYPPYYGAGYRTVSRTQYRKQSTTAKNRATQGGTKSRFQKSGKPQFQPKATSPKANANAAARRSSLSKPNRSQRSFSSRPNASRSSSTSRSSLNPGVRRSSSFRSGSSFGAGK